jgi:type II secretory pathway component PulF
VAAVAGAAAFTRIKLARATPEGRRKSDALFLRVPLAGAIIRHADVAGMSGLLGTLLGSGVNATEALRLTEKTVSNAGLRDAFSDARTRINEGSAFSAAFRRQKFLDEAELDILLVNESTGTLPRAFDEISRIRLAALDDALRNLVRTLSGVFLIAAFSIVFFCLVSVMLSVLQVSRSILG